MEEFRRELILVTLVFDLWLCIFLIFWTWYRIFLLQERQDQEEQERQC